MAGDCIRFVGVSSAICPDDPSVGKCDPETSPEFLLMKLSAGHSGMSNYASANESDNACNCAHAVMYGLDGRIWMWSVGVLEPGMAGALFPDLALGDDHRTMASDHSMLSMSLSGCTGGEGFEKSKVSFVPPDVLGSMAV